MGLILSNTKPPYRHSKSRSSSRGNVWVLYNEEYLMLVEKGTVFHDGWASRTG
jgi:hypothetical protein